MRNRSSDGINVAIDASRNRSGGAIVHLQGLLAGRDPRSYGIKIVHLWAYDTLLSSIPDYPWLVKHSPKSLEQSLLRQIIWQKYQLPRELRQSNCQVLLSTDAGTVCQFYPSVVMSRDMLSFVPQEMKRYPKLSLAWLRLLALRYVQISSLVRAKRALFLTNYALRTIQSFTTQKVDPVVIPHGVSESFRIRRSFHAKKPGTPIVCTYTSNSAHYKHHKELIDAFSQIRQVGKNVVLKLVGASSGPISESVQRYARLVDPDSSFISCTNFLPHNNLPLLLANTDIFVFASSCENMPNSLVEAMASGLPIACSDRGPMPEILEDAGLYFDPESSHSIRSALQQLIDNSQLRHKLGTLAYQMSKKYSWSRCAHETWTLLASIV